MARVTWARWCVVGLMVLACADGAPCQRDVDCPPGARCALGTCVTTAVPLDSPPAEPDAWGTWWDGAERAATTFERAAADCQARAARLPTPTEVYRNRGQGVHPLLQGSEALWSAAPAAEEGHRVTVHPDGGGTDVALETTARPYRCVRSPRDPARVGAFEGSHCHGPPEAPCAGVDIWAVDVWDRPAVDVVAARWECAQVNAGLPTLGDVQAVAHSAGGWPTPTGAALWSADLVATGEPRIAAWRIYRQHDLGWAWAEAQPEDGDPARGEIAEIEERRAFRCIGRARSGLPDLPDAAPCRGGCVEARAGRYPLLVDGQPRQARAHTAARDVCRALGGALPRFDEAPRVAGEAGPLWSEVPGVALLPRAVVRSSGALAFRCVWRGGRYASLPACGDGTEANEVAPGLIDCLPREPASGCTASACAANGGEYRDPWGNAWDARTRGWAFHDKATYHCGVDGGRLPTATELWAALTVATPPLSADHEPLWSLTPFPLSRYRVTIGPGGEVIPMSPVDRQFYRCIWPEQTTEILGRTSCYGPPGDRCVQVGALRADAWARLPLPHAAAAWECQAAGGRLPTAADAVALSLEASSDALWLTTPSVLDGAIAYARAGGDATPRSGHDSSAFRCVLGLH